MPTLNRLDFEQEEPLASDEQFLGEELSRGSAEEKWPWARAFFLAFFAGLAFWAILFFIFSRIF